MTHAENIKLIIAQLQDFLDQGDYLLAKPEFDKLSRSIDVEDRARDLTQQPWSLYGKH